MSADNKNLPHKFSNADRATTTFKLRASHEIKVLEEIRPRVYKVRGIAESKLTAKKLLENSNSLRCAVKMCDGTFHVVHSELQEVLEKNRQSAKNGFVNELLGIFPKEARSTRFLLFHPENSESAFLLGDVETALKMLAGK